MRSRHLSVVVALLAAAALTGCGGDGGDNGSAGDSGPTASPPSASATTPQEPVDRLPTGKDDLALVTASHLSPEGFAPEIQLDLQYSGTIGWTSVHRGADGFDLGVPEVVFAFLTPAEASAQEALDAVRTAADAAGSRVKDVTGWADVGALGGVDVRGGSGQLVASRDGEIALDATPEGRLQVFASDAGGAPLLVVVYVPDATSWADVKPIADRLASVSFFP